MTLLHFEAAMVSADRTLVDFLAEVFDLEELAPLETAEGVIYRLQVGGAATAKVFVPTERPGPADRSDPFTTTGLGYLTLRVDDLERVVSRAAARNGQVKKQREFGPGVSLAVIEDPDGNTIEVFEFQEVANEA